MSGNYAQLETAALAYKTAVALKRDKTAEKDTADKEVEQSTTVLAEVDTEVVARTAQAAMVDADLAKATSDETTLLALQTSLTTEKTAAVTARTTIWDKSVKVPPVAGPYTGGSLGAAMTAVAAPAGTLYAALESAAQDRDTQLNGLLKTARDAVYNKNNELDLLKAALKAAELNHEQAPTPMTQAALTAAQTAVTTKEGEIVTDQALVVTEETAYATKVAVVTSAAAAFRAGEALVVSLQTDYDAVYRTWLDVTNRLQDIEGANQADPDQPPSPNPLLTSKLGLATSTKTQLAIVQPATTMMKNDAIAAKSARKAIYDSDASKVVTTATALKNATDDLESKRIALEGLIKIQKKLEIDAAAKLLEEFLKNHDLRVASSPGVSQAVKDAVALTCHGSNAHNLLARIQMSYSTEAAYLAMCEILTEAPVETFFDSTMDECFRNISTEHAESIMAEIRSEFGKIACTLISKYGKCGKKTSSSSIWSWLKWFLLALLILVILVIIAVTFFGFKLGESVFPRIGKRV